MKNTDIKIRQPVRLRRIVTDTDLEGWCLGADQRVAQHI